MAVVLTLVSSALTGDGERKHIEKVYSLAFSGNYSGNGTTGEAFNPQTDPVNTAWLPRAGWARNPVRGEVLNQPDGYVLRIQPSTTFAGWGLRLYQGNGVAALAELSNGAYPAAITNDTSLRIKLVAPAL